MDSETAWGDREFDEELDNETEPDENGIKIVTEYRHDEDGKKIKVTKRVRTKKILIPEDIYLRRKARHERWVKFGKCKGIKGPEVGITGRGDEVFLVLGEEERKAAADRAQKKKDEQEMKRMFNELLAETKKAPIASGAAQSAANAAAPVDNPRIWKPTHKLGRESAAPTAPAPTASGSGYVPPHKRGLGGGKPSYDDEEETSSLKVTNLSDDTDERTLHDMFQPFGQTKRIYLVRDQSTGVSRGFAFVSYYDRAQAERAKEHWTGRGHDHLIVNVEWAMPSNRR